MRARRRLGFWAPRLLLKSFLSLIRALVKDLCLARSIMSWDPWGFMSVVCDAPQGGRGRAGSGPGVVASMVRRAGGVGEKGYVRSIESIMMNWEGVLK